MRGSAHFGFTLDWYRARNQFWVIRTLQMERVCAPHYLDDLQVRTWVSTMGRVRSDRNYEIRRVRDSQLIARAIANWVYVDAERMTPTRVHPDIAAMFEAHEPPALAPIGKVMLNPNAPARWTHSSTRRAQFYEADSMQHTNNAMYVDWVEEAVRDALGAMGYALKPDGSTPLPWFYRHNLEYVRPALPHDEIEIHARLGRVGPTRGEWEIEIRHVPSREQILRAQTTMLWVNAQNQPVSWQRASVVP